jgi:diguanylate cyclase (GGDEF)-like protein
VCAAVPSCVVDTVVKPGGEYAAVQPCQYRTKCPLTVGHWGVVGSGAIWFDEDVIPSIRVRLLVGQAVLIAFLVLACASSLIIAGSVRTNLVGVVRTDDALVANVVLRTKLMDDEETGQRGYLLTRDPVFLEPYRVARARIAGVRRTSLQLAAGDARAIRLLRELSARGVRWEAWAEQLLGRPRAVNTPAKLTRQMLAGKRLFDRYRQTTNDALRYLNEKRIGAATAANTALQTMTIILAGVFLLALLAACGAAWWTIRHVDKPIVRLARAAAVLGEGNLDREVRVDPVSEFRPLVGAMERMRLQIKGQRDLAMILASTLHPADIYESFAAALRHHIQYDRLSLSLVDPATRELETAYATGDATPSIPAGTRRAITQSIVFQAYQTGRVVIRGDLAAPPPEHLYDDERAVLAAGIRSVGVVPLLAHGQVVGSLNVGSRQPDQYNERNLGPVTALAPMVAAAIVNAQLYASLEEAKHELEARHEVEYARARQDALTGLGNRLRLNEDLGTLQARVDRYGHSYSLALCDVDYFKPYNDRYGHAAGDAVLSAVARTLAGAVRQGDSVYRYGGEEFLIVLPEQDHEAALAATERLRRAVEALALPHEARPGQPIVTISVGVATMSAAGAARAEDLVAEADLALYRAKTGGRNRVEGSARSGLRIVRPDGGTASGTG